MRSTPSWIFNDCGFSIPGNVGEFGYAIWHAITYVQANFQPVPNFVHVCMNICLISPGYILNVRL